MAPPLSLPRKAERSNNMKKLMWPEVAGSEWIAYGHPVKVHADGRVEASPEIFGIRSISP